MNSRSVYSTIILSAGLAALPFANAAVVVEQRALSKPAVTVDQPSAEWQMLQQLKSLQSEIDRLNGRLELQEASISTLKTTLKQNQESAERRIRILEDALISGPETPDLQTAESESADSDQQSTSQTSEPALDEATSSEGDQAMYMSAYEAFKTGGPQSGITKLSQFIKAYPQSPLVPNAHYWLGEFYLASDEPNAQLAELNFKTIAERYPDSEKSSTALYRLMVLEQNRGDLGKSRQTAEQILKRYPKSAEAPLAQAFLNQDPA